MLRHYVTYLLVLLIAVQSVANVGDIHTSHQSGTEHVEFNHSHQSPADLNDYELDKRGQLSFDCHHCCHCHSHSTIFLTGAFSHLSAIFLINAKGDYFANLTCGIPPSLFRPPIHSYS